MDRVIQTSLMVKCLQKECDWTGSIKDYEVRMLLKVLKLEIFHYAHNVVWTYIRRRFIDVV